MSYSTAGKKGAKASPWRRSPMVKKPSNWERMKGWGRVKPKEVKGG